MKFVQAQPYSYEPLAIINDFRLCSSPKLNEYATGNILSMRNDMEENFFAQHTRQTVQLQITSISRHISKFDFDEEYEEL